MSILTTIGGLALLGSALGLAGYAFETLAKTTKLRRAPRPMPMSGLAPGFVRTRGRLGLVSGDRQGGDAGAPTYTLVEGSVSIELDPSRISERLGWPTAGGQPVAYALPPAGEVEVLGRFENSEGRSRLVPDSDVGLVIATDLALLERWVRGAKVRLAVSIAAVPLFAVTGIWLIAHGFGLA